MGTTLIDCLIIQQINSGLMLETPLDKVSLDVTFLSSMIVKHWVLNNEEGY